MRYCQSLSPHWSRLGPSLVTLACLDPLNTSLKKTKTTDLYPLIVIFTKKIHVDVQGSLLIWNIEIFFRHPTVLYMEGTTNLHQIASSLETPCSQSLSAPGQAQTGTPPHTGTGWRKWRVGTDQTWGQTWPWCCLDFPLHSALTGHSASKWPADSPHSYQKIITGIN